MAMTSQVECDYMVLKTEQRSDELPVTQGAAEAIQKDDRAARGAEVADGEPHPAGVHDKVHRAIRQGAGDGTTSRLLDRYASR